MFPDLTPQEHPTWGCQSSDEEQYERFAQLTEQAAARLERHGSGKGWRIGRDPDGKVSQSQQVDFVVDAVVHARLFGRFELLTLDAQVRGVV